MLRIHLPRSLHFPVDDKAPEVAALLMTLSLPAYLLHGARPIVRRTQAWVLRLNESAACARADLRHLICTA